MYRAILFSFFFLYIYTNEGFFVLFCFNYLLHKNIYLHKKKEKKRNRPSVGQAQSSLRCSLVDSSICLSVSGAKHSISPSTSPSIPTLEGWLKASSGWGSGGPVPSSSGFFSGPWRASSFWLRSLRSLCRALHSFSSLSNFPWRALYSLSRTVFYKTDRSCITDMLQRLASRDQTTNHDCSVGQLWCTFNSTVVKIKWWCGKCIFFHRSVMSTEQKLIYPSCCRQAKQSVSMSRCLLYMHHLAWFEVSIPLLDKRLVVGGQACLS